MIVGRQSKSPPSRTILPVAVVGCLGAVALLVAAAWNPAFGQSTAFGYDSGYGASSVAPSPYAANRYAPAANQPIPGSADHYRRPIAVSGRPSYAAPAPQIGPRIAQDPPPVGSYGGNAGAYGTGNSGLAAPGAAAAGAYSPGPGLVSGSPYGPSPPYHAPQYSEVLPPPAPDYGMQDLPPAGPFADIIARLEETQTGRFMFGVGVNSDAGLTGQIVIDERNFDWRRPPTGWDSIANGTAFRGAGQGFRIEALPGTRVQRYTVNFTEPYLFNSRVSLNVSAFFYDRNYFDWDEQRLGGRIGLGYRITPDLSIQVSSRIENVDVHDPRVLGVPELDEVLGKSDLFSGRLRLVHDTRDMPFAPTEGHLIDVGFEQVFGSFDYPRASVDLRKYFLLRQRPDLSGRHTLGYSLRLGFSGSHTPLYEHYFAGGFSTLRGFDFRGASPRNFGVIVGGEFMMLGSAEYTFPITADDMLKGVAFVDYGTVEENIEINSDDYRVAVGGGLRIHVPAMGPAPIALDLAFPLAMEDTDDKEIFSFFIGFGR